MSACVDRTKVPDGHLEALRSALSELTADVQSLRDCHTNQNSGQLDPDAREDVERLEAVVRRAAEALAALEPTREAVHVTVRQTAGTYVARGGGKTASCTVGEAQAIIALANKLGFGGGFHCNREEPQTATAKSAWVITDARCKVRPAIEPIKADFFLEFDDGHVLKASAEIPFVPVPGDEIDPTNANLHTVDSVFFTCPTKDLAIWLKPDAGDHDHKRYLDWGWKLEDWPVDEEVQS